MLARNDTGKWYLYAHLVQEKWFPERSVDTRNKALVYQIRIFGILTILSASSKKESHNMRQESTVPYFEVKYGIDSIIMHIFV